MKLQLGNPVKHLLVDLDGTLLGNQSLPLQLEFVGRTLAALKKYIGLKKAAALLFDVHREFGRPSKISTNDVRVVELISRRLNLTLEETRHLIREGLSVIFPSLKRHFYPIPGSKEFLEWAKDHYDLTLATNPVWPREIVEMRVKWAGIDPSLFGIITRASTMHAVKPHPEYYREILEQQKLSANDCLLIGDDVKMDLPATEVGIRVFIVDSKKGAEKNLTLLKTSKDAAPAWRGNYSELKTLLEAQLSAPAAR
jgi:FMN phosphatase YigB (HAD superfamily)